MPSLLFLVCITLFCISVVNTELPSIQVSKQIRERFFSANLSLPRLQQQLLRARNLECAPADNFDLSEYTLHKAELLETTKNAWHQLNDADLAQENLDTVLHGYDQMCLDANWMKSVISSSDALESQECLLNMLIGQLTNPGCDLCSEASRPRASSQMRTWGYGLLFVTIISMSSLCGAFVIPLSNKKFYKHVLMIMIGIAVGSLAGSGLLHLIPQAFGIADDPRYSHNHAYVWKGLAIMGGVYLFYLVEKILKLMILRKKIKRSNSRLKCSDRDPSKILESIGYVKTHETRLEPNVEMRTHFSAPAKEEVSAHGHSHGLEGLGNVAPVAWMIIFGDGLHNFIDGLSIGAAFSESTIKGVSICLAVICEEFPHELGDFAILLNAGMSFRAALFFNFLSACSCYAGLTVGILLGDNFEANQWIFAIAGGMFLYIALCDMIPELNEMGEEIERDYIDEKREKLNKTNAVDEEFLDSSRKSEKISFDLGIKLKVLLMQNLGIVLGFSVMLVMAMNADGLIPE